jgi:hypothetical protein
MALATALTPAQVSILRDAAAFARCGCGHQCACAIRVVRVTPRGYQALRGFPGYPVSPTQQAVLDMADQVARVYRNGTTVFGDTPAGEQLQVKAPVTVVLGLVRLGLLVRREEPGDPPVVWYERAVPPPAGAEDSRTGVGA